MENATKAIDIEARRYINDYVDFNKQMHGKHIDMIVTLFCVCLGLLIAIIIVVILHRQLTGRVKVLENEIQILKKQCDESSRTDL